jgi:hypothetical protein
MEHRRSKIKNCKPQINVSKCSLNRAGSALVLVVVLTVLLASIGVMFLMMSRISEMGTDSITDDLQLRLGVNTVVDRIKDVLFDDLLGNDADLLNGESTGASDEYWDYPGDDDPWLASLEPVVLDVNNGGTEDDPTDDTFTWPHITDLYDNNFGLPDDGTTYYDPDDDSDPDQWAAGSGYDVDVLFPDVDVIARILSPDERVSVIAEDGDWADDDDVVYIGALADADGDGVADSRWIQLPNIYGTKGEPIYAAVRIVDNSGMININTAYRNPTNFSADWDGTRLSHVNLAYLDDDEDMAGFEYMVGFEAFTDFDDDFDYADIRDLRYGNATVSNLGGPKEYTSDTQYEDDVASRLLNPEIDYLPFDLSDELELRNRFFLYSGTTPRCSLAWRVTFNPGRSTVGRQMPYSPDDSDDHLYNWYLKATSPENHYTNLLYNGICNRRHLSTTLNLDRMIVPRESTRDMHPILNAAWNSWSALNSYNPISLKEYVDPNQSNVEILAAAIWLSLPNDAIVQNVQTRFGPYYSREKLACQYAVNIADHQSTKDDTNGITGNVFSLTVGQTTYFGLENIEGLKRDTLCISKVGYIEVNIATLVPPAPVGAPDGKYFAIELFNPDDTTNKSSLSDYEIRIIRGLSLVDSYSLASLGTINASSGTGTGDTGVFVITDSGANAGQARTAFGCTAVSAAVDDMPTPFIDGDRIVLVKISSGMPVDCITIPALPAPTISGGFNEARIKSRNQVLPNTPLLLPASTSIYNPWVVATAIELGTDINPATLQASALAGFNKVYLPPSYEKLRNVAEIENIFAIGSSYQISGSNHIFQTFTKGIVDSWEAIMNIIPLGEADREFNVEIGSFGKVRLDDPDYQKLTRYFSCNFEVFRDKIDNDGIDGTDDLREISVAGRININTAPWFVLAQLPWMQYYNSPGDPVMLDPLDRVRAVVEDRLAGQYENIGDILRTAEMKTLAADLQDNLSDATSPAPDFTDDSITDDFEESHIIFHRISDLITVRSDLFTAYILVRLDVDGPQKRMIAIFDRSRVFSRNDRVRLVALHPVPDPR